MESTLALKRSDIAGRVGVFLGWGAGTDNGDTAWTSRQEREINFIVDSGLRQFYNPPPVDGIVYDWSFLRPHVSLTLASGARSLDLPDDFGQPEGMVYVSTDSTREPCPLQFVNSGQIKQAYSAASDASGKPMLVAMEPVRGTTATEGQRFQLLVYPEADAEYTLELAYYLLPNALSGSRPYAYGGMAHAETILESCLAIAEQRLDDAMDVHTKKWQERLLASIAVDRKLKAQQLGYNGDASDGKFADWRSSYRHFVNEAPVTFNGVSY